MKKIAFDVVLLTSEEMTSRAIELNKKLLECGVKKIVLDKKHCLPHISLAMGVIPEKDIGVARDIVQNIAQEYQAFQLEATCIAVNTINTGEKVSSIEIKNNEKLQSLHEKVMDSFRSYIGRDACIEMLCQPAVEETASLHWIKNFSEIAAHEKFWPHITLGVGEARDKEFPVVFDACTIAVYQLGNYCTCRKNLIAYTLKKRI
ncbi:MAG: hypothetical protein P9M13_02485 [Candidatus Ancaeobacter aquaticus]|nr:hypothetical protein [Candidatus Ancaeobacter aquaticus]